MNSAHSVTFSERLVASGSWVSLLLDSLSAWIALDQLSIAAIMTAAKDKNMTQPTMIVMSACAEIYVPATPPITPDQPLLLFLPLIG
ncbi:MAG: hypothetical protein ABW206_13380 [Agrobacterium vaccinii]